MICPRCQNPNGLAVEHGPDREGSRRLALVHMMARRVLCDSCQTIVDHEDSQAREHERQQVQRQRILTLPRELQSVDMAKSPADGEAVDAAKLWVAQGGALTLVGIVGAGKTYLAAAATAQMMAERDVSWQSVPSMLAAATAAFGDDDRRKAVRAIVGNGALVLDDLDKIKPGDWAASQLFAAIDNRLTSGAPLLITLNKSLGELADFIGGEFGPAIASRLSQQHVVELHGADQRLVAP